METQTHSLSKFSARLNSLRTDATVGHDFELTVCCSLLALERYVMLPWMLITALDNGAVPKSEQTVSTFDMRSQPCQTSCTGSSEYGERFLRAELRDSKTGRRGWHASQRRAGTHSMYSLQDLDPTTAGSLKDVRYSVGRFCFLDLRYLAKTGAVNRRCPDNCLLASRMALPIVISMKLHAVQTVLLLR